MICQTISSTSSHLFPTMALRGFRADVISPISQRMGTEAHRGRYENAKSIYGTGTVARVFKFSKKEKRKKETILHGTYLY